MPIPNIYRFVLHFPLCRVDRRLEYCFLFILHSGPEFAKRKRYDTAVLVRTSPETHRYYLTSSSGPNIIWPSGSSNPTCDPGMVEYTTSRPVAEPEAKVLIIMTGGTICMQKSPNGLIPARGFLETCMSPRPEFNDGTILDDLAVKFDDNPISARKAKSLRTPTSKYGKRVR